MAATLRILRQQGALSTISDETRDRERAQREKDHWLAQHRQKLALRELERLRSRGQAKDQVTREYENRLRWSGSYAEGGLESFVAQVPR